MQREKDVKGKRVSQKYKKSRKFQEIFFFERSNYVLWNIVNGLYIM